MPMLISAVLLHFEVLKKNIRIKWNLTKFFTEGVNTIR